MSNRESLPQGRWMAFKRIKTNELGLPLKQRLCGMHGSSIPSFYALVREFVRPGVTHEEHKMMIDMINNGRFTEKTERDRDSLYMWQHTVRHARKVYAKLWRMSDKQGADTNLILMTLEYLDLVDDSRVRDATKIKNQVIAVKNAVMFFGVQQMVNLRDFSLGNVATSSQQLKRFLEHVVRADITICNAIIEQMLTLFFDRLRFKIEQNVSFGGGPYPLQEQDWKKFLQLMSALIYNRFITKEEISNKAKRLIGNILTLIPKVGVEVNDEKRKIFREMKVAQMNAAITGFREWLDGKKPSLLLAA